MVTDLLVGFICAVLGAVTWSWCLAPSAEEENETLKELRAENEKLNKALSFERSCLGYLRREAEGLRFEYNCTASARERADQEVERLSALIKEEQQESYKKDQRIVELQLLSVKLSKELLEQVEHQEK